MPRRDLVQYRRGTSQEWADVDPILMDGEIGYDKTWNQVRVGDGVRPWSALFPIAGGGQAPGTALQEHLNSSTPHKAYDIDLPDLALLFENGIA